MFSIDGEIFNISAVSIKREVPMLSKYEERTENGDLQRELIGIYYNYELTFPSLNLDTKDYAKFWDKLTEPVAFHDFMVPASIGQFEFRGYITGVSDTLKKVRAGKNYWGDLSVKFIAQSPARR